MKQVVLLFIGWFLIINLFAVLGNNRVNLNVDTSYPWINPDFTFQQQGWDPTLLHSRWDGYWYQDIARNGYRYQGPDQLSNLVFFPLYPLLIKTVSLFMTDNIAFSGWLVSSVFALLSVIFLFKIVKEFHPQGDPQKAVFLMLIFPTAFFLNSIYTESTYLFFSLAAYYFVLKKKYLLSGVMGFGASLSRLTGVFLFLPLIIEYFLSNKKRLFRPELLAFLLIPLGTISFFFYHYLKFGDFFLFFKVEKLWGRGFSLDLANFSFQTYPSLVNFIFDSFFTLLSLVIAFLAFKKLRFSYGVYILITLILTLSSGTLMSISRYALILFPIFIYGSTIKNKLVNKLWVLTSTLLFGLYTLLLVTHYWAG